MATKVKSLGRYTAPDLMLENPLKYADWSKFLGLGEDRLPRV